MGKAILILLLGSIAIYGIISISVNRSTTDATQTSTDYYKDVNARNIANSMVEMLTSQLRDSTTFRVQSIMQNSFFEGTANYRVVDTVLGSDSLVKIVVTANYDGVSRTSTSFVKITSSTSSNSPPPFMSYAAASGGNLQLNGNVTITDDNNNNLNANIHTNGNFEMNGSNSVDGFLSYVGNATASPMSKLDTDIHPNLNPESLPNRSQTSVIEFPTFDPDSYLGIATDVYFGNKTYSSGVSLGTAENPKIIYISGNLTLKGTVSGYGSFIVKGNVTINGNIDITSPDENVSNMGIYTSGNLTVNGNVTLRAQVYTEGNATLSGSSKIYGSLTTKGNISFGGNTKIYYKPANVNLTDEFWPSTSTSSETVSKMYHYE